MKIIIGILILVLIGPIPSNAVITSINTHGFDDSISISGNTEFIGKYTILSNERRACITALIDSKTGSFTEDLDINLDVFHKTSIDMKSFAKNDGAGKASINTCIFGNNKVATIKSELTTDSDIEEAGMNKALKKNVRSGAASNNLYVQWHSRDVSLTEKIYMGDMEMDDILHVHTRG